MEEAKLKGKEPPVFKDDNKACEWNLTMTKMDVRRLSKNFAFMIRTLKDKTSSEEISDAAKAVLEHHFDNHQHCGSFCRRKAEIETGKLDERKCYRDEKKDTLLCDKLQSVLARFLTLDMLKEVAHSLHTCANESFNNTVSWAAPKNKMHAGSNSLRNRMSTAIGIKTLGTSDCHVGLCNKLGIALTPDVLHFLTVKSRVRRKQIARTKTSEYKRERKADEYERLKHDTKDAKRARAKRDGSVHKSGIGMTGGYDLEDEEENEEDAANPSSAKRCSKCKKLGHLRPTNKLCQHHKPRNKKANGPKNEGSNEPVISEEQGVADEMDAMDNFPLQDNSSTDAAFFSATGSFDSDADAVTDDATSRGIL